MGTYYQSLVGIDCPLEEAGSRAQIIRAWLITRDIIEPEPMKIDAAVGNISWYRDREGADSVVINNRNPADYRPKGFCVGNGLGIGAGWQCANPFQGKMYLTCPDCGRDNDLNIAWNALASFKRGKPPDDLVCHLCRFHSGLMEWHLHPAFAIGHIAVVLVDWPTLKESFIRELRSQMGGRVKYVADKL